MMSGFRQLLRPLALCALIGLSACGGAGDGGAGATGGTPPPVAPVLVEAPAPIRAKLVELSSSESGIATASWLPASEDAAVAAAAIYELHASAQRQDFIPSSATLKFRGSALSAKISGLGAGADHAFKLVAEVNGKRVVGDLMTVRISDTPNAASAAVTTLSTNQIRNLDAAGTSLTLEAGAPLPAPGGFLASGRDGGFLLRVLSARKMADGAIQVATRRAALDEVVPRINLSSSVALPALPPQVQATQAGVVMNRSASGGASLHWPQTGLTLSSATPGQPAPTMWTGAAHQVGTVDPSPLAMSKETTSVHGDWGDMSAPTTVTVAAMSEGKPNFPVLLRLSNPQLSACRYDILSDDNGLKLAGAIGGADNPLIYLNPKNAKPGIYKVVFIAYLGNKQDGCQNSAWVEAPQLTVDVKVTSGSEQFNQEESAMSFTGGVQVEDTLAFQFDPTLSLDLQLPRNASIGMDAIVNVSQTLHVTASGAGMLDKKTKSLVGPKEFTKVFLVGGVPVVVSGTFWLDFEISGSASGTIDATEQVRMGYSKLSYILNYDANNLQKWTVSSQTEPTFKLTLAGEGDAQANLEIALVPRMKVQVYGLTAVGVALRPTLSATAGLHATAMAIQDPKGVTSDADIWLTKGQLEAGLTAYGYADLHTFWGSVLTSYPDGANADDYNTYHPFELIQGTTVLGLPEIRQPEILWGDTHPKDSRAIHIRATAQDVASPFSAVFGPPSFLPFAAWKPPKVIAQGDTGYYWIAPPDGDGESNANGLHTKDYWLVIDKPGVYRLRVAGNSAMGDWARQVGPDVILDMSDANNDGIPDRWASKYSGGTLAMWNGGGAPATWTGPNQAPLASFIAAADGLTVGVDASASRDNDGSIASYEWDFGDGGKATSKSKIASRTYAKGGTYTVRLLVTDNKGASNSVAQAVVVGAAGSPTVSTVSPDTLAANGQGQTLTINGAGFAFGSKVKYRWGVGSGAGVWTESNGVPAVVSANQIRVPINPGTVTDTIQVQVCNRDNCSHDNAGVKVMATPSITSITPDAMTANGTRQNLLINGSGFANGVSGVQFRYGTGSGAGGWGDPRDATVSVVSPTQIRVAMNPGSAADRIDVRVCNVSLCSDGAASLVVTALPPVLSSLNPGSMVANDTRQTLTISGSGFASGISSVKFKWGVGPGAGSWSDPNDATVVFDSATQIRVLMNPGRNADIIYVKVCNGNVCTGGGDSLRLTSAAPTVSSVSPGSMGANGVRQNLDISGSGFISGVSYVQFKWGAGSGANSWNMASSPAVVDSATHMHVSMNPGTVQDTIYVRTCNAADVCSSGAAHVLVTP